MATRISIVAYIVAFLGFSSFAAFAHAGVFYSDTILADGPVGYWRLNETSGAAVNSGTAGAGLNGTYNNFPTGVRGAGSLINANNNAAAQFNGLQSASGSTVTGSGLNAVSGGNPFANDWTIEAWFVRDAQHQWSGIFSNNTTAPYRAPLMTFIDNSHQLGINGSGATPNNVSVDLGAGSLGEKVYAVITKTGGNADSTANLTVYANVGGTWLTPATGTNNGWALATYDSFVVGRHFNGATQMHDGIIDEVAIYDRALSLGEINAHFNAGNSFVTPEPSTALAVIFGIVTLVSARRRRNS